MEVAELMQKFHKFIFSMRYVMGCMLCYGSRGWLYSASPNSKGKSLPAPKSSVFLLTIERKHLEKIELLSSEALESSMFAGISRQLHYISAVISI